MHIVYIHQFFCTDQGSSGTRSFDVSRHLAAMGHKVTVICGVLDVGGIAKPPWYKPFRRLRMGGFDVVVCNVLYSNYLGRIRRIWSFVWFAFLATLAACTVGRPDVVFATSLPLTVGLPGYLAARRHRVPFVFEVRDICPEGDVIAGYLRQGSPLERALALLERFDYVKADKILLVSPGFQQRLIERGYPAGKMRTVLLGADGDVFRELRPDTGFRRRHGLEAKTVAVYAGAHGKANGLYYVLEAAKLLTDRADIAFALIGDGHEKPALRQRAEELGLANVKFLDLVPKSDLPGVLAACDIGLMILRDVGEPRPVTPNKIFDYMFAALPSIVNFRGPTIDMVQADRTGVFADPQEPAQLARAVVRWADKKDLARETGTRARRIAYEQYDRRIIARQLVEVFQEVLRAGRSEADPPPLATDEGDCM